MRKLCELYPGESDCLIRSIKINSKEVEPGDLFVCTMGVTVDRHDFIEEAIERGAAAIVVSKKGIKAKVPVILVEDTNQELPKLCAKFYDHPEEKLFLIGVTGTNGKTSVAEMIQQLLGNDLCSYIGTNGIRCSRFSEPIRNTTPDADRMFLYLNRFVEAGCKVVCMETSSEAFYRDRLSLLTFDISILTNITQDHLNIHKTIENYVFCKSRLFAKTSGSGFCLLNSSSNHFTEMKEASSGKVETYGTREEDDLRIQKEICEQNRTLLELVYQGKQVEIISPLLGKFNVWNLTAAIHCLLKMGYSMEEIQARTKNLHQIPGRMENLKFGQNYQIILDYAHTEDALDQLLSFLNTVKQGRIITVTGSAGGREREKRPFMGQVVLGKSDYVIFTMDDPREEDPNQIIDDMIGSSKCTNYERIISREEAIRKAFTIAKENDIVLIVGKGRDNYMAIGKEYLPYCDYTVIANYFHELSQDDFEEEK